MAYPWPLCSAGRRRAGRRCASPSCRSRRRPRRTSWHKRAAAPRARCRRPRPRRARAARHARTLRRMSGRQACECSSEEWLGCYCQSCRAVREGVPATVQTQCKEEPCSPVRLSPGRQSRCLVSWPGACHRHCAAVPAGHGSAAGTPSGSRCPFGHPAGWPHARWCDRGSCRPRTRAQPAAGGHVAICAAAERHFRAIREAVAGRGAPATLKAGFLAPLARDLPAELAVHVFARTDADFMGMFVGARARAPASIAKWAHRRAHRRAEGRMQAEPGPPSLAVPARACKPNSHNQSSSCGCGSPSSGLLESTKTHRAG